MTSIDSQDLAPVRRHRLAASVLFHLVPGAFGAIAYAASAPLAAAWNAPPMLALSLVLMAVLVPIELGHLLIAGRRQGSPFRSLLGLNRPARPWLYLILTPCLLAAAVGLYLLGKPAEDWILQHVFGWLPQWFLYSDVKAYAGYSRNVLLLTLAVRAIADLLVLPLVEELYFRGYLLPRIPAPGWLAPILSTALFALYHLWQPYNAASIFCFFLPTVVAAWIFKDVRVSLYAHLAINLLGFVSTAVALLHA